MNEMIKEAINILKENDRGGYTVPTSRLYPFQWNWDSGFTAMGLWHFNKWRAWLEIISLLDAQWENGMIPHIVFRQSDPDYFPGPDIWHSNNEPPTSCVSQPPVLATIVWQMVEKGTPYDTRKAKEIFSRLMASHRWFMDERDPVDKGIIATVHPWETGRDNCPDWDLGLSNVEVPEELESYIRRDTTHVETEQRPTQQEYDKYMAIVHFGKKVGWNNETIYRDGPFLMADPGIHFILLRATKDLLLLAKHLNMEAAFDELQQWIDKLTQGSQWLWNDFAEGFCARDIRTGTFSDGITNASMLCFYANVGNAEQQEKMRSHCERILDKCNYGFPSWDPEHKSFDKIRYWRGPVWLIMNHMISKGLLECGFDKPAHRIMNDTRMLVEKAGMAEYFDPMEGRPLGGQNFSWTAAIYLEMNSADVSEDNINRV